MAESWQNRCNVSVLRPTMTIPLSYIHFFFDLWLHSNEMIILGDNEHTV